MADKTRIEDGGPAFPTNEASGPFCQGMSLRDYFAAHASEKDIQAQQQWTANTMASRYENNAKPKLTRAECRYRHADAMLAARAALSNSDTEGE